MEHEMVKILFRTIEEVAKILPSGFDVVIIKKPNGFELYDNPRNPRLPFDLNYLLCNLEGARVRYGNQAFLFSSVC